MSNSAAGRRVLATIVFSDVVGYSALMQRDERHTLGLVRRDLKMISEECHRCGGTVVKSTGDGLLMRFSTAGKAVECALRSQSRLARGAKSAPPSEVLHHRIGIHLGDVFISESDAMGDGVNIAARLMNEAEPDGICLSQTVYDVVKNRLQIQATFLGPRELKNIREAVPAYQIVVGASKAIQGESSGKLGAAGSDSSRKRWRLALVGAGFALAAGAIVAAVVFARRPHGGAADTNPIAAVSIPAPAAGPASAPAMPATQPAASRSHHVHLLPLVEVEHPQVAGQWRRNGFVVSTLSHPYARIAFPYEPPDEYDMIVDFMLLRGGNVALILRHAGKSFVYHLGVLENTAGGFELVNGKYADSNDTTVRRNPFITPAVKHACVVQVRKRSITVFLDGVMQCEHPTDYSDLDMPREWFLPQPVLGIGADRCLLRISAASVNEVTGEGKELRATTHPGP